MPIVEYKNSPVAIGATGAGAIEEGRGIVRGFASTYGNVDLGGDVVDAGAFTTSLRTNGNRRVILWQHDQTQPLGIGTFTDSAKGLEVEVQLSKSVQRAGEALELAKMGALSFSIGYTVKSARGTAPRHLAAVDLMETSLVTFPMNPQARILSAKEAADQAETERKLRELIADIRHYTRQIRRAA